MLCYTYMPCFRSDNLVATGITVCIDNEKGTMKESNYLVPEQ